MKIKLVILLLIVLSSMKLVYCQNEKKESYINDVKAFGLGVGQDYGGIGVNLSIFPFKNFGVFGGVGHAIADIGYNIGLKYRFKPKKNLKLNPFLTFMYGYNAAIAVTNKTSYNKLFYGTTLGIGIDYKNQKENPNYWSFSLNIPFRSAGVNNYIDELEDDGVKFDSKLLPISLSIAYKFSWN